MNAVVFSLNGQLFGVDATQVIQLIKYKKSEKKETLDFIEGVADYRESPLPLIDMANKFGLGNFKESKKVKVLVSQIEDLMVGFIVDDVKQIMKFSDEDIRPTPLMVNSSAGSYIRKVCMKDNMLISIIDLERVLSDDEINELKTAI